MATQGASEEADLSSVMVRSHLLMVSASVDPLMMAWAGAPPSHSTILLPFYLETVNLCHLVALSL
jgi:hypothetical protein